MRKVEKNELVNKLKALQSLSPDERSYLIDLLNQKKYGLVWEEKPEDVEEQLRQHLPVLEEVTERAILNGEEHPNHILIEGDNLHALTALSFSHEGKIDVIYIDPPYNTGNKDKEGKTDFKYNDHYVDSDDEYRHSLWLSFMAKRLRISKKLLAPNGFIAISIDDNEIAQLKILLDEIFNEKTKIIAVKMSEASGLKMSSVYRLGTIPKYKEYLLLAKPSGISNFKFKNIPKGQWDDEYNIFIEDLDEKTRAEIDEYSNKENLDDEAICELDKIAATLTLKSVSEKHKELGISKKAEKEKWNFENAWRICQCATSSSVLRLAEEKKKSNTDNLFFVKSLRSCFKTYLNLFNITAIIAK